MKFNTKILLVLVSVILISTSGCLGMPDSVKPVTGFDLNSYLGKWYEIARLDHSFERGLSRVTAQYGLRQDGGVSVLNRGYSDASQKWEEAEGKAYFVNGGSQGYLKVSFFGPFYGSYVIFELDHENYQYAFISGPDNDYLWFLSRSPSVSEELKSKFITMAAARGFDTNRLIFVKQD
jgi:apolipoprotein D and lipocalin family protein